MNVLIITNQLFEIKNNRCYCIENFYDILLRFAKLGRLTICCREFNGRNSHNTIDQDVTSIIPPDRVHFIKREYGIPNAHNTQVLESQIAQSDLIIGYLPSTLSERSLKIAHKHGKKFMSYLVACTWDSLWNHSWKGKCVAIPFTLSTKRALKNSDYALYVTEKFLQSRYPTRGLSVGCSDVKIPHLDDSILRNRIEYINKSVSDNGVLNIVTVAAVDVRYKGQKYVIKALAKLKRIGIDKLHYFLIGGGDKSYLENLVKKYGIENQVHFMGTIPHSEIFAILDKMHVYIQPSLQEGLPRSVVEAMSRGLLCIGAKTAAMPDMLDNRFIVRRKSVSDIEFQLNRVDKSLLQEQAIRNFNEAKEYQETILDNKRTAFFNIIKNDLANNKYLK